MYAASVNALYHDRKERRAWKEIPSRKCFTMPCLEDPTSWKPDQLAITLLAKERGFSYETVEKKTVNIRKHRKYQQITRK
jgi:hypothetical protein